MNSLKERTVEQKLTKAVKAKGGLALKFVSPNFNGVPDRLILMPFGKMAFVELKAPKKKMRAMQIKRKRQLESLGFSVYCVDDVEMIGDVIDEIEKG